jgi:hypothetical protein
MIVGVAANVRFNGLTDESALDVYVPNTQLFAGDSYFVIRTVGGAPVGTRELRRAIDEVDREQSFFDVQPIQARVDGSI